MKILVTANNNRFIGLQKKIEEKKLISIKWVLIYRILWITSDIQWYRYMCNFLPLIYFDIHPKEKNNDNN